MKLTGKQSQSNSDHVHKNGMNLYYEMKDQIMNEMLWIDSPKEAYLAWPPPATARLSNCDDASGLATLEPVISSEPSTGNPGERRSVSENPFGWSGSLGGETLPHEQSTWHSPQKVG